MYEKLVVITRRTRLEQLISRFNTKAQAKFYIEHSGGDFSEFERENEAYHFSLERLRGEIQTDLKVQFIEREFLPNFIFTKADLVVALGQDGLVANAAKYVGTQPIIGVNPDPDRCDGILVPHKVETVRQLVATVVDGRATLQPVTLAEAILSDGQRILAFNDLFIGARSHVSARYELRHSGKVEQHSSSGIIVSTGAGSTGWLSSIFNMVAGITNFLGGVIEERIQLDRADPFLLFVVREPFVSKHSSAQVVAGTIDQNAELVIESRMATEGIIFSDGVESDFLTFNAGSTARVRPAQQKAHLVLPIRGNQNSCVRKAAVTVTKS